MSMPTHSYICVIYLKLTCKRRFMFFLFCSSLNREKSIERSLLLLKVVIVVDSLLLYLPRLLIQFYNVKLFLSNSLFYSLSENKLYIVHVAFTHQLTNNIPNSFI